tara:strand:+ start:340 stop:510 length:171 start_codon:yes stop_codon:yes gene_type:complete
MRAILLIGAIFASCTPKTSVNEEIKLSNTEIEFVSDEVYYKNQAIIDSLHTKAQLK